MQILGPIYTECLIIKQKRGPLFNECFDLAKQMWAKELIVHNEIVDFHLANATDNYRRYINKGPLPTGSTKTDSFHYLVAEDCYLHRTAHPSPTAYCDCNLNTRDNWISNEMDTSDLRCQHGSFQIRTRVLRKKTMGKKTMSRKVNNYEPRRLSVRLRVKLRTQELVSFRA